MRSYVDNWQKFILSEDKKHFEVEIYLKFSKDMSLYGSVFNKLRAIDGITIVKVSERSHVKNIGAEQKAVVLDVKFIPKRVSMRHYRQYLKNEILKIKDEEGNSVVGARFVSLPRGTG